MNQLDFINKSNVNATIVSAVIEQLGGWDAFVEESKDVVLFGGYGGVDGFTHIAETKKFVENIHFDIAALMINCARTIGMCNALAMIASLKYFRAYEEMALGMVIYGQNTLSSHYDGIVYGMAVFALEQVCGDYQNMLKD